MDSDKCTSILIQNTLQTIDQHLSTNHHFEWYPPLISPYLGWLKSLWNDLIIIDRSHCWYLPSDIPQPGCRMHPSCQEFWCQESGCWGNKQYETRHFCPEIKHGDSWKILISCVHIYVCMIIWIYVYIYMIKYVIIYYIIYIHNLILYIYI